MHLITWTFNTKAEHADYVNNTTDSFSDCHMNWIHWVMPNTVNCRQLHLLFCECVAVRIRMYTVYVAQPWKADMPLLDFLIFGFLPSLSYLSIKTSRHRDSSPPSPQPSLLCITLHNSFMPPCHRSLAHSPSTPAVSTGALHKNCAWLHPNKWGPHTSQSLD